MENQKKDLEGIIWEKVKNLDKRIWVVLFSTIIWGIFAHGMALFNKYSVHDDCSSLFGIGTTYTSGRWMLAILGKLYKVFFGGSYYSLPLFNGFISILCIAFSTYLIINLLNIKQWGLCISIAGILVSFPVITGTFGYMFTAPYYMIAILFAVLGVWIANKKTNALYFLVGVSLMCCSIGIYQAFIPVMMSLALLCFICKLTAETSNNPKELMISGVYLAGAVISGVLLYFLINKFILAYKGMSLTNYKNINTMGKEPISVYLSRIPRAVYRFFVPKNIGSYTSMFPFRIRHFYIIILLFVGILSLYIIIKAFRKNIFRGVLLTLSVLMLPLTFNFVFVMSETVYTLMLYGQSMLFVYFVWLINICEFPKLNITKVVYGFGTILLLFVSFSYCRYANINYLKAEYEQQRMISYFTVLITQIKSVEGYQDEMPVCYINSGNKEDLTLKKLSGFDLFYIAPYKQDSINDYAWIKFMNNWCGFNPETVDGKDFINLPEVVDMPYYPDDGSIKIINDTVVVKFGPVEE
ncbi:MAG: glucosyltransferase domain-containing protein [Oscillospiraceae bacterium]|nr:glucosyltransferase domain-containing protein [Oscillospiraceae bacterium]